MVDDGDERSSSSSLGRIKESFEVHIYPPGNADNSDRSSNHSPLTRIARTLTASLHSKKRRRNDASIHNSKCRLLRLPPEIRNRIFEFAFTSMPDCELRFTDPTRPILSHSERLFLPLITCKHIYETYQHCAYRYNTLVFHNDGPGSSLRKCLVFLNALSSKQRSMISSISLNVEKVELRGWRGKRWHEFCALMAHLRCLSIEVGAEHESEGAWDAKDPEMEFVDDPLWRKTASWVADGLIEFSQLRRLEVVLDSRIGSDETVLEKLRADVEDVVGCRNVFIRDA